MTITPPVMLEQILAASSIGMQAPILLKHPPPHAVGSQGKKVTILYSGEMVEVMAVTTVVSATDLMAM
jgi:hypothetical protein